MTRTMRTIGWMTAPALLAPLSSAQEGPSMTAAPAGGGADMMGGDSGGGTLAPGGNGAGGQAQRPPGLFDSSFTMIMFLMIGMLVLMMWSSARRQKREQAKRQDMIASLRKGDTVLTIAGIKGTVAESPDGRDDIALIVDELTRTRIRFAKTAITQVVREGGAGVAVEAKAGETQPAAV